MLFYKVEYCAVLSFQSNVVPKFTRTHLKLKDIDVKVLGFENKKR